MGPSKNGRVDVSAGYIGAVNNGDTRHNSDSIPVGWERHRTYQVKLRACLREADSVETPYPSGHELIEQESLPDTLNEGQMKSALEAHHCI